MEELEDNFTRGVNDLEESDRCKRKGKRRNNLLVCDPVDATHFTDQFLDRFN
jgi:hypothetical protein